MRMRKEFIDKLIGSLRALPGVRAAGLSGDPSERGLNDARDIDLFVYCDGVPGDEARADAYRAVGNPAAQSGCGSATARRGEWGISSTRTAWT